MISQGQKRIKEVAFPENDSDTDTIDYTLNTISMKKWIRDTIEGFHNLFHFLYFAIGIDLIVKDIKETEAKSID